eukprot:gnl/Dysnectes_brevis/4093_a5367_657.p1 GENE.gnl/Dysnectes_brevis/4093_a5367_657~~gnl/Dysnectes_brevis/4093_a5367_657.p1  ORF type:complete len:852 (+),score=224.64 gnl/Dysnectes_brevis/4093_a5367_657:142-2697(+)
MPVDLLTKKPHKFSFSEPPDFVHDRTAALWNLPIDFFTFIADVQRIQCETTPYKVNKIDAETFPVAFIKSAKYDTAIEILVPSRMSETIPPVVMRMVDTTEELSDGRTRLIIPLNMSKPRKQGSDYGHFSVFSLDARPSDDPVTGQRTSNRSAIFIPFNAPELKPARPIYGRLPKLVEKAHPLSLRSIRPRSKRLSMPPCHNSRLADGLRKRAVLLNVRMLQCLPIKTTEEYTEGLFVDDHTMQKYMRSRYCDPDEIPTVLEDPTIARVTRSRNRGKILHPQPAPGHEADLLARGMRTPPPQDKAQDFEVLDTDMFTYAGYFDPTTTLPVKPRRPKQESESEDDDISSSRDDISVSPARTRPPPSSRVKTEPQGVLQYPVVPATEEMSWSVSDDCLHNFDSEPEVLLFATPSKPEPKKLITTSPSSESSEPVKPRPRRTPRRTSTAAASTASRRASAMKKTPVANKKTTRGSSSKKKVTPKKKITPKKKVLVEKKTTPTRRRSSRLAKTPTNDAEDAVKPKPAVKKPTPVKTSESPTAVLSPAHKRDKPTTSQHVSHTEGDKEGSAADGVEAAASVQRAKPSSSSSSPVTQENGSMPGSPDAGNDEVLELAVKPATENDVSSDHPTKPEREAEPSKTKPVTVTVTAKPVSMQSPSLSHDMSIHLSDLPEGTDSTVQPTPTAKSASATDQDKPSPVNDGTRPLQVTKRRAPALQSSRPRKLVKADRPAKPGMSGTDIASLCLQLQTLHLDKLVELIHEMESRKKSSSISSPNGDVVMAEASPTAVHPPNIALLAFDALTEFSTRPGLKESDGISFSDQLDALYRKGKLTQRQRDFLFKDVFPALLEDMAAEK